jgi:hypothetical protein
MTSGNDILRLFGQYSKLLAHRIKVEGPLSQEAQTYVESHILIVQLALASQRLHRKRQIAHGK